MKRTAVLVVFALLFAVCGAGSAAARTLSGAVNWIADGDTLQMTVHGERHLIRLAGIDAPEGDQPWGEEAREALSNFTLERDVRAEITDRDKYGRYVARIYVGQANVNRAMVASGNAWVYPRYATDEKLYALQREARAAGEGLWQLPKSERIPPWIWRRSHDSYDDDRQSPNRHSRADHQPGRSLAAFPFEHKAPLIFGNRASAASRGR